MDGMASSYAYDDDLATGLMLGCLSLRVLVFLLQRETI